MKDEAFSHLRYKLFAAQARENGNAALADLFEKVAVAEYDKHFKEQAQIFGLVKSDKENLAAAISDEYLETMKMYADMAKRAEAAGDSAVSLHFATRHRRGGAPQGLQGYAFKEKRRCGQLSGCKLGVIARRPRGPASLHFPSRGHIV